jgi:hypothetical protein
MSSILKGILSENTDIGEAVDPAQQTVYMQVKGLVDQLDKRGKQNVSKALKKNLGVVTEEEADYGDDYQNMVKRVGKLAKEGPRKTVYDPIKKVHTTVPVGQPKTDDAFQAYLAQRRAAKQGLGEGWKEETAEHNEFLAHARQQLQSASPVERTRLAQRLSKLEQKHFPEMFSSDSNGISSSIASMLQNVIDSRPRPNQQFGNVVTPQGTGATEPLRPEPINYKPTGATTSFAEPDSDDTQDSDPFQEMIDWYQSADPKEQQQMIQNIANQADMTTDEAKAYLEYAIENGEIEPEEWKQQHANTVDEGFDPIRPLDLKHWAQKVKMYYPDARFIRAKMPGGPSIAKSGGVQVGLFDPSKGIIKITRPQGVSSISDGSTMEEGWSQKYKNSINCSHPKGFSQKAHCAGKKKHNESVEMEMVCEDCGMCETHADHENLDEACWKGYHKEGNKKMFGKTYPNCVKNEDMSEGVGDREKFTDLTTWANAAKQQGLRVGPCYGDHNYSYHAIGRGGEVFGKFLTTRVPQNNRGYIKKQDVAEGYDSEELANEVYAEFERIYPNLARRAHERTIHAAIMDVLNYGGDNNPGALAQDVARAVKQQMQQGVAEGSGQTINLDNLHKLINRTDYNLARRGDPSRYHDVEVDERTKIIYWVTQETTTKQSQEFAIRLANILKNNGFNGWTVKVVRRDFYNGKRSPWKVAIVEQGVAEGSEDSSYNEYLKKHANAKRPLMTRSEFAYIQKRRAEEKARSKNSKQDVAEESCPHCSGPMFSEMMMNEKKDACYYKVKSRYKVWPSAYASGALVKCRKKGADSWGNGGKKNESSILEGIERADENLHQWFKEKWVRFGPDGKIRGACARGDDSEGKPKCLPQSKAQNLGKKGRASAASRKRREDPNPERHGKAINVATKKKK